MRNRKKSLALKYKTGSQMRSFTHITTVILLCLLCKSKGGKIEWNVFLRKTQITEFIQPICLLTNTWITPPPKWWCKKLNTDDKRQGRQKHDGVTINVHQNQEQLNTIETRPRWEKIAAQTAMANMTIVSKQLLYYSVLDRIFMNLLLILLQEWKANILPRTS